MDINFELVDQGEPYFHAIAGFLGNYLTEDPTFQFDSSTMADHVVSAVSIGSVICSLLDPEIEEKIEQGNLTEMAKN